MNFFWKADEEGHLMLDCKRGVDIQEKQVQSTRYPASPFLTTFQGSTTTFLNKNSSFLFLKENRKAGIKRLFMFVLELNNGELHTKA